jgi:hypothetical protein
MNNIRPCPIPLPPPPIPIEQPAESTFEWQPEDCHYEEVQHNLPALFVVTGFHRHEREFVQLNVGDNLAEVLMALSPDRWGGSHVSLFWNALHEDNRIPHDKVPEIIIAQHDLIICYAGPADPITAGILAAVVLGGGAGLIAGVGVGLLVGATVLGGTLVGMYLFEQPKIKTPETVSDQGAGQGTLGIPRNQARLGSRIPDIFGYVRTWPDLVAPVVDFYDGRDFSMDIYYCLGMGSYNTLQARFGDTDLAKFPGSTYSRIEPAQLPYNHGVLLSTDEGRGFQLEIKTPTNWSSPITLPGVNITQIWVDLVFPGGLIQYRTAGDPSNQWASGLIQWARIINGVPQAWQEQAWYCEDKRSGTLRFTRRVPNDGGFLPAGEYMVRVAMTNRETSTDNIHIFDAEIGRLAGYRIAQISLKQFNRARTHILVQVRSTRQTGPQSYENFNLYADRLMPFLTTGGISMYTASRRWCDALTEMLIDPFTGNYPLSDIDIHALLDVQQKSEQMDFPLGGRFCHIYDRFMDVDEQFQSCANAMRAAVVQDYGLVTVIRDETKGLPSALITAHNRADNDQGAVTLTFASLEDNDGVEIEWFDVDNDFIKRVYRHPPSLTLLNPRKVEIVGLTHWAQVWRRANYESFKQTRRRRTNTITVYEEGLLLLPMDLVEVTELWDTTRIAEVVGVFYSATPYQSYFDIQPGLEVNANDYMVVSSERGTQTDAIGINASIEGFVTRLYIERQANVTISTPGRTADATIGGHNQIGSRVAVYNEDRHIRNRWLVGTIKPSKDQCLLTLIEYDPDIFLKDTAALPANPKPR